MATTTLFESPKSDTSRVKRMGRRAPSQWIAFFSCMVLVPCIGHATEAVSADDALWSNLPQLPGEEVQAPASIDMDAKSIAVGESTYADTWGATLSGYREADFSIAIQQGWMLSDTLGAGSVYTFHNDYIEAMINGVYAPQPDLRIQLTASQLRSKTNVIASSADAHQEILQTSHVLDVQKKWKDGGVLSEAGVALFSADAKPGRTLNEATSASTDTADGSADSSHRLATGSLNGFALNLILQPTYLSSIRMAYERTDISYHSAGNSSATDSQSYGSIQYAHSFRNCSTLHGSVSRATYFDEMNLHFKEGNWNFGVLHTRADGYSGTSLHVNYSIQLGGPNKVAARCVPQPDATPSFDAIVDTTTARPQRLAREPLVRVESADAPEASLR